MFARQLTVFVIISYLTISFCKDSNTTSDKECVWSADCECKADNYTRCLNIKSFPKFVENKKIELNNVIIDGRYEEIPKKAFQFTSHINQVNLIGSDSLHTIAQPESFSGSFHEIFISKFQQLDFKNDAFSRSTFDRIIIRHVQTLTLPPGIFSEAHEVDSLTLSDVGLRNITKSGSFLRGLKTLTKLDLSNNSLDSGNLDGLLDVKDTLTTFICMECGFTELPEILGSFTKLKMIDLRRNDISNLPKNVFPKLANLQSLWLSDNPIGKANLAPLADIKKINSFKNFRCNNCHLKEIPTEISTHPYLRSLALERNNITTIREKDFDSTSSKLPKGEGIELLLRSNQISKIEPKAMVSLKWAFIALSFNQLTEFDMSWIPHKVNDTDVKNGLALKGNEQLKRVFVSDVSKAPKSCSVIDLSDTGIRELDKNVFFVCLSEHVAKEDFVLMKNVQHFDCSKNLVWLAPCANCRSEKAAKECNGNHVLVGESKCDNKTTIASHLKEIYLTNYKDCKPKNSDS